MQMSEEKLLAAMETIESTRDANEDIWIAAENVRDVFGTELAWS